MNKSQNDLAKGVQEKGPLFSFHQDQSSNFDTFFSSPKKPWGL